MSLAKWPSIVQRVNCQLYISRSRDPFLNLSIEHYLLTKTPAHSKILFLYYNKPCVVIGRNQNPWLEVNLHALGLGITLTQRQKNAVDSNGGVEFLRRRSGGGTVYHDEGNLNYCAICPSDVFTRDQHAEMVTRAIRHFNPRARVNQRHDIVLDQGDPPVEAEAIEDMHRSGYETDELTKPPMKMSGSAFKIVKGRGLHHGTCLLDCDRLGSISHYLHSPARGIISALGVESVRSPVGNAFDGLQLQQGRRKVHQEFQSKLFEGFQQLWNIDGSALTPFESVLHDLGTDSQESRFYESEHVDDWTVGTLTDDVGSVEEIKTGMNELKSDQWRFQQTPKYTINNRKKKDGSEETKSLIPGKCPKDARVNIEVKHGIIQDVEIFIGSGHDKQVVANKKFSSLLSGKNVAEEPYFEDLLYIGFKSPIDNRTRDIAKTIGGWLDFVLGKAAKPRDKKRHVVLDLSNSSKSEYGVGNRGGPASSEISQTAGAASEPGHSTVKKTADLPTELEDVVSIKDADQRSKQDKIKSKPKKPAKLQSKRNSDASSKPDSSKLKEDSEKPRALSQDLLKDLMLARARDKVRLDKRRSRSPLALAKDPVTDGEDHIISKHLSRVLPEELAPALSTDQSPGNNKDKNQIQAQSQRQRRSQRAIHLRYIDSQPKLIINKVKTDPAVPRIENVSVRKIEARYPPKQKSQAAIEVADDRDGAHLLRYNTGRGTYVPLVETPAGRAEQIGKMFEAAGLDHQGEGASAEDYARAVALEEEGALDAGVGQGERSVKGGKEAPNHLEYRWLDDLVQDIKASDSTRGKKS